MMYSCFPFTDIEMAQEVRKIAQMRKQHLAFNLVYLAVKPNSSSYIMLSSQVVCSDYYSDYLYS